MIVLRAILAVAMMVVGGTIIVRMLHYPIAQTFTGIVLGLAMIALGAYRLHQLYHARAAHQ
jgi:putative effector of murein hydrolase LrgA (UPF0299 family)